MLENEENEENIKNKYMFYVNASDGFPFKSNGDLISHFMKKIIFYVTFEGIYIAQSSKDSMDGNEIVETAKTKNKTKREEQKNVPIFLFLKYPVNKFNKYFTTHEFIITLNARSFKETMQCTKRKDSVSFMIENIENPSILNIIIEDENPKTNLEHREQEYKYLPMTYEILTPELKAEKLSDIDDNDYYNPITASSTKLHKQKKDFNTSQGYVNVKMQFDNFLSCSIDIGKIRGGGLLVGKPLQNKVQIEKIYNISESDIQKETQNYNKLTTEKEKKDYIPYLYSKKFSNFIFNRLTQLNSLNKKILFYLPKDQNLPLRIYVENGDLGSLNIFIIPI
jgi:hypothetical protein